MFSLEPMMRIYDDNKGACLEIRVSPDFPGVININTPNDFSKEFYGDISLNLDMRQAKLLIKGLQIQLDLMDKFKV